MPLDLAEDLFAAYLSAGKWGADADDKITGETVDSSTVGAIVEAFNNEPESVTARNGLGLLALLLGIAEWGVAGSELPPDPNGRNWRSDTGEDSGKHLMSYAVGGIGISHADVGDLEELVRWLAQGDIVPASYKPALLALGGKDYHKSGIVYDELRAAGICHPPVATSDLLGEPFHHFNGPGGADYCSRYHNDALTSDDWLTFRTWMRAALRTEAAQRWLLDLWFTDYWAKTMAKVPAGDGAAEEMLVNVRVRNSSPKVANAAIERPLPIPGAAGRVQREIDAYADWKPSTARRRWRIMMRPVVLYRHFSGLEPLQGVRGPD